MPERAAESAWREDRALLGVALHDTYHAGQIRLIVRLWEGAESGQAGR